jgi:hypothetical protein
MVVEHDEWMPSVFTQHGMGLSVQQIITVAIAIPRVLNHPKPAQNILRQQFSSTHPGHLAALQPLSSEASQLTTLLRPIPSLHSTIVQ